MEDFITYELAIKLKEKGFDWKTAERYVKKIQESEHEEYDEGLCVFQIVHKVNIFPKPTISQVLKWLREEKLILIGLSPMQGYDGNEMIEWWSTIYKADKQGGMSWMEELYYESYEQAALAGIEYVLDNLI